jgi:hypothetical protein
MSGVALWQRFAWRGHQVVVIQQWTDPFGRDMLRIADPNDDGVAAGMPVDEFLAEAVQAADEPDHSPA